MPFFETRAHLQSFETKMEFIRPKLTETWPFEIWIFKKINRKNRKGYRRERVNKWWKTWKLSLKCDFLHVFAIPTTSGVGKPDCDQFPQVSLKIFLIC